jgi:hypothetical protein
MGENVVTILSEQYLKARLEAGNMDVPFGMVRSGCDQSC